VVVEVIEVVDSDTEMGWTCRWAFSHAEGGRGLSSSCMIPTDGGWGSAVRRVRAACIMRIVGRAQPS
jgi:hypothetical protein